jgi:glycosyltransferase involved in cell wall biosynthesis
MDPPRVTLGIATYDRDTYLADAIGSGLAQGYDDFELLVVCDGSANPRIDDVLARFAGDPRLRVVRHPENRGIAAAYDTIWREGRGELIAMLGDDDVSLPDRLARQVAIFDRWPDTGVVHGDALMIDGAGAVTGRWDSRDFTPAELVHAFFRSHNHLVDPTRMVHRRVYEAVGGYDGSYAIAQDLHFWLRAARAFRFRHVPGGPLTGFRRHGANTSDESARAQEVEDVERALAMALELYPLRELVPELDWDVLDPVEAERQAWLRLAEALERRLLPLPGLATRVRSRAAALPSPAPRRAPAAGRRLLMTAFGWNDAGGGTIVPRLAAKELARRGWDVTVFHAAVKPAAGEGPYYVAEWEEDGVRLLGVHNRRHGLWDRLHPERELDDPPITAAYAAALDRLRPDVVHFHNLHNLGAALIDATAARGIPSYFTTHNYWLVCPRAYLQTGEAAICAGPGDGARCATCVGGRDPDGHRRRFEQIRARVGRGVTRVLAVSDAVRETLAVCGYPAEMLDVVRQGMPHDMAIWDALGRDRRPGRALAGGHALTASHANSGDPAVSAGPAAEPDAPLTVAFVGSAYPHKGPQLLVEAAQRVDAPLRVQIHGEVPDAFRDELLARDRRGVVELCGAFRPSEMARVLADVDVAALPSVWWDCAPLVAAECRAGRVPLLVPRLGGLAEVVLDGVDGLVFDALSVEDLARKIERVATEPGLLERLQAGIEPPRAFADYVDELEAYYCGERSGWVADGDAAEPSHRDAEAARPSAPAPERLAVLWRGEIAPPGGLPCRVQQLAAGTADPPLPHVAHVEVRTTWPPDQRPPAAGRLVLVQPTGAAPLGGPLADCIDELWVANDAEHVVALNAGCDPARVHVVEPTDAETVAARLATTAARPPRATDPALAIPRALEEDAELRVLATPAWRAALPADAPDPLAELLAQWHAATTPASSACLYLLADPAVDGTAAELEAHVLSAAAAAGVDLECCADINLMVEPPSADRDARLHAAIPLYVALHPACTGHERLARATGGEVVRLDGDGVARRLSAERVAVRA